jgi:mannose-6-phosphate isomerase
MVSPSFERNPAMNAIVKPWGAEELLEKNESYVVKRLIMNEDHCCSLQYHEQKHETVYLLEGKLLITHGFTVDQLRETVMLPGDFFVVPPKMIHRMKAVVDSVYLEASTPQLNDVIRLQDNYGRANEI